MSVEAITLSCSVNGTRKKVKTLPMARLLDVIREDMGLTGTKEGCGEGECGACSVLLDGKLVNSCLVPAAQAADSKITTIEGVARGEKLTRIQECFITCGGAQCGICTPGMVLAAVSLLDKHPHPKPAQIRESLAGNLCRCTGFTRIFRSVVEACRKVHKPINRRKKAVRKKR